MPSTDPLVDPANAHDMRIFSAACILAKHLQYAAGEAFHSPMPTMTTPVTLWQATRGAHKEWWIRRAMELLRTFDPQPIHGSPVSVVTGLQGKVIGSIEPKGAA